MTEEGSIKLFKTTVGGELWPTELTATLQYCTFFSTLTVFYCFSLFKFNFFRDTGTCFLEAPVGRDCPSLLLPLSSQRFSLLAHSQCHSHFHILLSFSHQILHWFSCSYSSISRLPKLLTIGSYPQTGRAAVQVCLLRLSSKICFLLVYFFLYSGMCFLYPSGAHRKASCCDLNLKPLFFYQKACQ